MSKFSSAVAERAFLLETHRDQGQETGGLKGEVSRRRCLCVLT